MEQVSERIQRDYKLVCDARDNGSRKAYADLMSAYKDSLYLLLLRMTRNSTTADDLTMETFGKAFMSLNRYSPTGSFSSWLYAIGVNTYIDHVRRHRLQTIPLSHTAYADDENASELQIPSGQPTPEESLIRAERDESLKGIIECMKEPYREVIKLRYYEELSYEEIAKKMGLPLGTVKVRLSRAKEILSAIIKKKGV